MTGKKKKMNVIDVKQLAEKTIIKRIQDYISNNKYLSDPKYFKNNYWSMAAWDSWAAKGQAGGCSICNNNFYNASLRNKRANTTHGGQNKRWHVEVSSNVCSECVKRIEINLNVEFKRN